MMNLALAWTNGSQNARPLVLMTSPCITTAPGENTRQGGQIWQQIHPDWYHYSSVFSTFRLVLNKYWIDRAVISDLASNLSRIAPNETNLGLFFISVETDFKTGLSDLVTKWVRSDWPQIGHIRDFFKSYFNQMCLGKAKCTEI